MRPIDRADWLPRALWICWHAGRRITDWDRRTRVVSVSEIKNKTKYSEVLNKSIELLKGDMMKKMYESLGLPVGDVFDVNTEKHTNTDIVTISISSSFFKDAMKIAEKNAPERVNMPSIDSMMNMFSSLMTYKMALVDDKLYVVSGYKSDELIKSFIENKEIGEENLSSNTIVVNNSMADGKIPNSFMYLSGAKVIEVAAKLGDKQVPQVDFKGDFVSVFNMNKNIWEGKMVGTIQDLITLISYFYIPQEK